MKTSAKDAEQAFEAVPPFSGDFKKGSNLEVAQAKVRQQAATELADHKKAINTFSTLNETAWF